MRYLLDTCVLSELVKTKRDNNVVDWFEKRKPMAAFDSIIAATARAYDCKLVTRNVRDFAQAGVEIVNPWLS